MTRSQLDRLLEKTVADALGVRLATTATAQRRTGRGLSRASVRPSHTARQLQHA